MVNKSDISDADDHPLVHVLRRAAAGEFPRPSGEFTVLPSWDHRIRAVVALTGHAYVCADRVDHDELEALGCDGFGGAHSPAVTARLMDGGHEPDCLDVLLSARGRGVTPPPLLERPDLAGLPRARRARMLRREPVVLGRAAGSDLVVVGRGTAGLAELSIEAESPGGSGLLDAALDSLPASLLVLAAVAPGNARSLRAFLTAGWVPLGSVQLFVKG